MKNEIKIQHKRGTVPEVLLIKNKTILLIIKNKQ